MKKSKIAIFLVLLLALYSMPLIGCVANKFSGTYVCFWGSDNPNESQRYDVIHLNSDNSFSYEYYLRTRANFEFYKNDDPLDVGTWKKDRDKCVLTYKTGIYSNLGAENSFIIKDNSFNYGYDGDEKYTKIDVEIEDYIKTHQASLKK